MKSHSRFNLVLTFLLCLIAPLQTFAQFAQQGGKLVGIGSVGQSQQGIRISLSSDGNTALVGGSSDNGGAGAVWVWTRTGGVWMQQGSKLVGTGAVGSSNQGSVSLSSDGNTALVGGYGDNSDTGTAWIWTRSGGVWTQQGNKLVGTGAVGKAFQGQSVSLSADGNTALVGGFHDNGNRGAVWMWTRTNGIWMQQGSKLVGTGAVGAASQGESVSLSADGNTALIGGPSDSGQIGAMWVWTRLNGVWTQQGSKLVGTGGVVGDQYQGVAVSLSSDGNTALVGGTGDNDTAGAAWIWTRLNGVWTQQGNKLVGTGAIGAAQQGSSVSLSSDGNTALIGGSTDNSQTGAAWVWTRSNGVWAQQGNKLVGIGAIGAARQGISSSLSGDGITALVGGPFDNASTGAAWVYVQSPAVPTLSSPANTAVSISTSPNLSWYPSRGAATYRVQLSTDSTFVTPLVDDSAYTGSSRTVGPLLNSTVYYWRVNASNAAGGTSAYTATWKFTTGIAAPAAPTLIAPIQNFTVLSAFAHMSWTASASATSYSVEVSLSPGFTTTLVFDTTVTGTTLNFLVPAITTYYWRVNAMNAGGTSVYSSIGAFNTASVGILPGENQLYHLNLENSRTLGFTLKKKEHVVIQLFNAGGRMVSQLLDETRNAGAYSIPLSAESQGVCYLDFRAGDFHRTMRIQP